MLMCMSLHATCCYCTRVKPSVPGHAPVYVHNTVCWPQPNPQYTMVFWSGEIVECSGRCSCYDPTVESSARQIACKADPTPA